MSNLDIQLFYMIHDDIVLKFNLSSFIFHLLPHI